MPIDNTTQEPTKELGKDDILDILSADDEPDDKIDLTEKPPKKEAKVEIEEDKEEDKEEKEEVEEIDELEELEKELEEPTDDELELITPVRRSEIIKKYPIYKQIEKDFPYITKAYYREQQFTEIFPNPSDARDAKEKADTLVEFETSLLSGDLTKILEATKGENKESFNKLADNYLLSLSKVDESAYNHVIGNIIKSTIRHMVQEADASEEKNVKDILKNAAVILNQFVFGTSKFTGIQKLSKDESEGKSDREKEIEERERNITRNQFETAQKTLETSIDKTLKNTISSYIDPKKSMTDYVRRNAEREALETIYTLIDKDPRFTQLKDKLWKDSSNNGFNTDKLKSAYLSKAKTLLPSVIKKARNEALKGMGKRVKDEVEEQEQETDNKEEKEVRKSTSSSNRGQSGKKGEIPSGMSNRDYIMQD